MIYDNPSILEPHYSCGICHRPVSNPICANCLLTEIDIWLTQYPNYHEIKKTLYPKLKKFLINNLRYSTTCIKCNNTSASVCPHCFTEFVLNELRKMELGNQIINEFRGFFNFH